MYIILDKKRWKRLKSYKTVFRCPAKCYNPLFEFRTKPDLALTKMNLERLADSGDELYNVASNTAYQ
jgi:hypothetical protein